MALIAMVFFSLVFEPKLEVQTEYRRVSRELLYSLLPEANTPKRLEQGGQIAEYEKLLDGGRSRKCVDVCSR
jgi:hypothetical protein